MASSAANKWFMERGHKIGRVADMQTQILLMNAYDEIIANGPVGGPAEEPAAPEAPIDPPAEPAAPEPVAEGGG